MHLNRGRSVRLGAALAFVSSPLVGYHGLKMMYTGVPAAVGLGGFIILIAGIAAILGLMALIYL